MTKDYSELNDLQFCLTLQFEVKQMRLPLKTIPNSPYWITNFRINGNKICRSTRETDKTKAYSQAELIWQKEKAELERPNTFGSKTLNEAINHWLSMLSKKGNPRSKSDKQYLDSFRDKLGDKPLGKITSEDLTKIRKEQEGLKKGQTINRRFVPLISIFNMAVKKGWIEYAPIYEKAIEQQEKIKEPYTDEELTLLIKACYETGNTYLVNPIYFARATGFRANEIRQLRKLDVLPCRTKVRLGKEKNGVKNRTVSLNKTAQTVLLEALLNPSEYVFHCPRSKNGGLGDYKKAFTTVRKKAGLLHKDFHTLRHTAITEVAKQAKNVFELKQFSRHKSISQLDRYVHNFEDEIVELASFELNTGATTGATD